MGMTCSRTTAHFAIIFENVLCHDELYPASGKQILVLTFVGMTQLGAPSQFEIILENAYRLL